MWPRTDQGEETDLPRPGRSTVSTSTAACFRWGGDVREGWVIMRVGEKRGARDEMRLVESKVRESKESERVRGEQSGPTRV